MPQRRPTPADEFERVRRGLLRIARESVAAGRRFPGEVELARRLDCGRGQIRRVMGSLEHDGIVMRRQGVPTRIDPVTLALSMRFDERRDVSSELRDSGYSPTSELLSATEQIVDAPEWARLDAAGVRVVAMTRVFFADGRPAVVEDAEVLGGSLDAAASDVDDRVWTAAQEPLLWEVASIGVLAAPRTVAEALDIDPGTVLARVESVHIARTGRHAARTVRWYRPEYLTITVLRSARPRWDESPPSSYEDIEGSGSDDEDDG